VAIIETRNNGPLIVSSTYWGSDMEKMGLLYLSINAGAFRLLLPAGREDLVEEMRTGKTIVISRGPWADPVGRGNDSLEILFDDGTKTPFSIHLGAPQADRLPADSDAGRECILSVWMAPGGVPEMVFQSKCWYRLAPRIPFLQPLQTV
jgi:hypothetical protein